MGKDLATRVQQNNTAQQSGQGTTIYGAINGMQENFKLAAPKGVEAVQLIRDALTAVRQNPNLAKCDRDSVLGGLMTCAQLGLRPGVLGHAWLVPFKGKAQLVIGYQGYLDLMHRSGRVESIAARTVHVNDHFQMRYGAGEDVFEHTPCLDGPRGEPRLYYAVARTLNGGYALTDPVTHTEMQEHRDKYAMARDKDRNVVGPWRDNFEAMAHKTMILKLIKYLPKSTDIASATVADGSVRVDMDPQADPVHVSQDPDVIEGQVEDDAPAGVDPESGENTNQPGPDGVPPVPDK